MKCSFFKNVSQYFQHIFCSGSAVSQYLYTVASVLKSDLCMLNNWTQINIVLFVLILAFFVLYQLNTVTSY